MISTFGFLTCGFVVAADDVISIAGLSILGGSVSIAALLTTPHSRIMRTISAIFQQAVFGLAIMMACYIAAISHAPLADALALRCDKLLGYDWRSYIGFVTRRPSLAHTLSWAYDGLFGETLLVTLLLGATRHAERLPRFVVATMITLMLTVAIFALVPLTTAWVHLGITGPELARLHLIEGGWPVQLLSLRDGTAYQVSQRSNFAIVGFPSYHTAAGLLNCWAVWHSRRLRWPFVGVSAVMISATPVNGGHYLVDLIGAVIVVIVSICLARRIVEKTYRNCTPTAVVSV